MCRFNGWSLKRAACLATAVLLSQAGVTAVGAQAADKPDAAAAEKGKIA